jgi:phage terminase small subunit
VSAQKDKRRRGGKKPGVTRLLNKQRAFADEYLIDMDASAAALRAGYSKSTSKGAVRDLLNNPNVQAYLAERMKARQERTEITQDRVLKELWAIVTVDANEIVEHRRESCPKCWDGERRANPNPACSVCRGEGIGLVFAHDTRKLSPAARALYAGTKQSRTGIEVKLHDKMKALELVGRHLGMWKDKVEHSGKVESTTPIINLTVKHGSDG